MLNLDPCLYATPQSFIEEREQVFSRTWQLVGPASKVVDPGSYAAIEIAGLKVFVLRGRDGILRGFRNVCRHRGARLLEEGTGRCGPIRCPYHNWAYNDEGRLLTAPWFGEDPAFCKEDWPLVPISVREWRGLLFAAIAPEGDLEAQLADLAAELADEPLETYGSVRSERLVFDANWKIYTDNFVEGYHIPGIHPGFFAAIDFEQFKTTAQNGFVRMTAPPRDGLFYRGKWLWMWPNWTLSLFDGGMNTSRINPIDHQRTELIYNFYFADPTKESVIEDTIARNLEVVREDFGICIETHRNYATGAYTAGPLSPRHEAGVAYFQGRLKQSLGIG
ncbi:MAG TPA: aromatic ring-hydroxylating dioxygenase subunit alpha [Aestuariivirgaceae bacterium]|nr:aromatic ring-hydroxylating dioxygenase subunit alpha [Aestuariivirgaceae bacterium]